MVSTCQTPSESPRLRSGEAAIEPAPLCQVAGTILTGNSVATQPSVSHPHFTDPNNAQLVECQEERLEGNIYVRPVEICSSNKYVSHMGLDAMKAGFEKKSPE